jgi:hypothetical protein
MVLAADKLKHEDTKTQNSAKNKGLVLKIMKLNIFMNANFSHDSNGIFS